MQARDPNLTGQSLAPSRALSKFTDVGFPSVSVFMDSMDSSESSGCIRMKPMPSEDQSVFRKRGLFLSYRIRQGSCRIYVLDLWKMLVRSVVHSMGGMVVPLNFMYSFRRGLIWISNQGTNFV